MLKTTALQRSFGGVKAVAGVNLTVSPGEILGIIGPNGSGKSTLINIISGFISPDEGEVELDGVSLVGLGAAGVRRAGISRTFQNLRLLEPLTAVENLKSSLHLEFTGGKDFSGAWLGAVFAMPVARRVEQSVTEAARRQLDLVGLGRYSEVRVAQLPYGLKKRLEIGRALLGDPQVILLDEPTAGLAAVEAEELIRLVTSHRGISGRPRGIILIEHHLEMIARTCTRLIVMNEGSVIAEGDPATVVRHSDVQRVYVGS